jgi:hypothetical protein
MLESMGCEEMKDESGTENRINKQRDEEKEIFRSYLTHSEA